MVQQMTELNARLKRQALILALLPDLVVVIDDNGIISFCSEQVERVLNYRPEALVGSKLTDLLVPSSRGRLMKLVKSLVNPGTETKVAEEATGSEGDGMVAKLSSKSNERHGQAAKDIAPSGGKPSAATMSSTAKDRAVVASDPSFPMSVVKVATAIENEQSDTSTSHVSKEPSSLTISGSLTRSPTAESLGNSGSNSGSGSEDTAQRASANEEMKGKEKKARKGLPRSDTSNTSSSLDAEVKKLSKANANLERNVRYHNTNLKKRANRSAVLGFKDDVTGAEVTANNASARLSSLRVPAGREPSSEDDSGYRESNDSREETSSSSASDTSESNGMSG